MAFAGKLLRSIVFSAAKFGVRKLAYAVGAQGGVGTYAESAADFSLQFIEDVCKNMGGSHREDAARLPAAGTLDPAVQRELKAEIAEAAQATGEQMRSEMNAAIAEAGPTVQAELSNDDREALLAYAAMLPERIRRTMQRADDPSGRTIPESTHFRTPLDVAEVLPPMPRFQAGATPVYNCTLTRILGVGTFGEVWEASKFGFQNRRVALKFCTSDERSLMHEAALAQRLDHPGIVQLVGIHRAVGDVPFCLEYEFVDGVDLGAWFFAQTLADADRPAFVAGIIAELAEIVAAAHAHRADDGRPEPIVHRDLKPANVLVPRAAASRNVAWSRPLATMSSPSDVSSSLGMSSAPRFKITDFGIGGIQRAAEQDHQSTRRRTITRLGSSYTLDALGAFTPRYAPEEQVAGAAADPRQDIHALGVIWFQLLRRDLSLPAPRGGGWKRQLRAVGVVDAHIELIERCVDSDPAERPSTGGELAAAIRAVQTPPEATDRRVGTAHHSPPPETTGGAQTPGAMPTAVLRSRHVFDAGAAEAGTAGIHHDLPTREEPSPAPRIVVPAEPKIITPPKKEIIEATFPMTADQAREVQAAAARALGVPVMESLDLGNGAKLDMMLIPAGEFMMGSPDGEKGRSSDEGPVRRVRISKPFRLGRLQVTQAQWKVVIGNAPSHFSSATSPVETVSWDDAQRFCVAASHCTGKSICLPSEAEWEYARRAGSSTSSNHGDELMASDSYIGCSNDQTQPCDVSLPNAWGLHDMHGQVWEWCRDWYKDCYDKVDVTDPSGPKSGEYRVLRGGWQILNKGCRSASRYKKPPNHRNYNVGFRVASGITVDNEQLVLTIQSAYESAGEIQRDRQIDSTWESTEQRDRWIAAISMTAIKFFERFAAAPSRSAPKTKAEHERDAGVPVKYVHRCLHFLSDMKLVELAELDNRYAIKFALPIRQNPPEGIIRPSWAH